MSKSVVLIPAFNAAKTVGKVIEGIDRNLIDKIIVVNDGSRDDTGAVLRSIKGISVLEHSCNKGYGASTITLYKEAIRNGFDYFIMMHADKGHDPGDIASMLQPLKDGKADVVIGDRISGILNKTRSLLGSRFLGAALYGEMPAYKFVANIFLTKLQNECYRTNFLSFHSGYRACSRKVLAAVPFDKLNGWYLYDTEFLVSAYEHKLKILEVPVNTCYSNDSGPGVPVIKYGIRTALDALHYCAKKRPIKNDGINR